MLSLSQAVTIPADELEFQAVRAQGAGGQHVNKVSTAIHLRFDIHASSLPDIYKQRLWAFKDQRISSQGIIVIKAQLHRSQEKNRHDALMRLKALILKATAVQKKRRATKPTRSAQRKRLDKKSQRGKLKSLRSRVNSD